MWGFAFFAVKTMSGRPSSLFKIINGMRYFGVGTKVTRSIYKFPETYWLITRVVLSRDQDHGKVFGRLVWRGRAKETETKIAGPLKKEWSLVSHPNYGVFSAQNEQLQNLLPSQK